VLFLTTVFAETNRNPFDLPEGESEIVAGFHLEYSSMKFALFFMAEYAHMIVSAALIASLYFGGYQIPWFPRPVLEQHAGVILPVLMIIVAGMMAWAATLFFRRTQSEKGRFGDARDREPWLMAVGLTVATVMILLAFGLKPWQIAPPGASLFATLIQIFTFIAKVVFFTWFFIWVRWTLPRFRFDLLWTRGWKFLLPLALANLVVTALVLAWIK
jgi:NADH-quinone oxidoreductase subunit H